MGVTIRKVTYFYAVVHDVPGEGYRVLSTLSDAGVNLFAFSATALGPDQTQFQLFPEHADRLQKAAHAAGLTLGGPNHAFLVQGDDELGALAGIHLRLAEANVNVFASVGVADGRGGYGYLIYVRHERMADAARALGL